MQRRQLLAAAAAAAVPMPAAQGQGAAASARLLRFVPQSDLGVLDPIVSTAYVTRHHGFMVWDTLYGMDADYRPQPQMVEAHAVEEQGKRVTLRLREGLRFHDGGPVRARDCVASVRRWAVRDPLGQALMAATAELAAPDDRTIRFDLRRPFPLLFEALGKPSTPVCFIMPERLASQDPAQPFRGDPVGSGPFRFLPGERVAGQRVAYARFADYVPRAEGTASWTAGPKQVHLDRVEWHVIPDPAAAAAALQNGEIDWWEQPPGDVQNTLRRNRNIVLDIPDPTGLLAIARFNHLHPPFDNAGLRRALLGAVAQGEFMEAVIGSDRSLWRDRVGFFAPGSPMASDAGIEVLAGRRDMERVKRALSEAGYEGQRVTLLATTDVPSLAALARVGHEMLRAAGMEVEVVAADRATLERRRESRDPPGRGGWSILFTFFAGIDMFNPGVHQALRGNGAQGWAGWPTSARIEELRQSWLEATEEAQQRALAREIQQAAFHDVPYLPLGQYFQATAYRRGLTGVLKGLPLFWSVQRG
jgi:peptide/nickel transport system substrate-binding protein